MTATPRPTVAQLREENERLRRDLTLVGRAIKAEADARGWCSDYERVMAKLNSKLLIPLPGGDRFITSVHYEIGLRLSVVGLPQNTYMRAHMPTHEAVTERFGLELGSDEGRRMLVNLGGRLNLPSHVMNWRVTPIEIED